VYCERNEYPKHTANSRSQEPIAPGVSTIGKEKLTSPTYNLQMAAEISFVSLIPTEETTQHSFQKAAVL